MKKWVFGLVAGFLILCAYIWIENLISHSFAKCVAYEYARTYSGADQKGSVVQIIYFIIGQFTCSIHVIDVHNGFFSVIATLAIAAFTFTLWRSTNKMWKAAAEQSADTKSSIHEATRASDAMEKVAVSLDINAKEIIESVKINRQIAATQRDFGAMQLRPYLSVIATDATFQEREKDLAFDARAAIVNNGMTPAHKVNYWAQSDILDVPLPPEFDFPPPPVIVNHSAVLGAHQNFIINSLMVSEYDATGLNPPRRFIDDALVPEAKAGKSKAFYMWGVVNYEDGFGAPHKTRFCHWYVWLKTLDGGEVVRSFYHYRHNDAD